MHGLVASWDWSQNSPVKECYIYVKTRRTCQAETRLEEGPWDGKQFSFENNKSERVRSESRGAEELGKDLGKQQGWNNEGLAITCRQCIDFIVDVLELCLADGKIFTACLSYPITTTMASVTQSLIQVLEFSAISSNKGCPPSPLFLSLLPSLHFSLPLPSLSPFESIQSLPYRSLQNSFF